MVVGGFGLGLSVCSPLRGTVTRALMELSVITIYLKDRDGIFQSVPNLEDEHMFYEDVVDYLRRISLSRLLGTCRSMGVNYFVCLVWIVNVWAYDLSPSINFTVVNYSGFVHRMLPRLSLSYPSCQPGFYSPVMLLLFKSDCRG